MEYLTITQVATRLRRNPALVYRWIVQGRLKAERVGPVWLVSKDALSRFAPPPRKWTTTPKRRRTDE
jgi:excisionase family DNA binding protein